MASSPHDLDAAACAFEAAMVAGDPAGIGALMRDDVVLVSPLTDRFRFGGRASVVELLVQVHETFEDFRYVERICSDGRIVLRSRATVRGSALDELALLALDDVGLVAEVTVFMRPLPATAAVLRALTPPVARARAGRGASFGAARIGGLILGTTRLADHLGAGAMRGAAGVDASASRVQHMTGQ
jgi:hypothetical protein